MATKEEILDAISSMTVLELSELLKEFEDRFGVTAALPVPVVIENKRAPALRFLLVVGLVPDLRIEPALDAGRSERRPQHIVVVEIHVAPRVAGVDRRQLFGVRIVELQSALALSDREQFR